MPRTFVHGPSVAVFVVSILIGRFVLSTNNRKQIKTKCSTKTTRSQSRQSSASQRSRKTIGIKQRTTTKQSSSSSRSSSTSGHRSTLQDAMVEVNEKGALSLSVQSIGRIESVYRLCVGTPRQGLLAPHARGRIVLNDTGMMDAVDGLEGFSHIWIVFVFHLNTLKKKKKGQSTTNKIAPPALGGQKVGVLATRSPHRFNPIGITLARLDGIRFIRGNDLCKNRVCLDVSGLDLVDGTPVLDIKPFVGTYDAPAATEDVIRVPPWVAGGLATKRPVFITEQARRELQRIVRRKDELEFYGSSRDETPEEAYENMVHCIEEVLSIDVRSSYQTKKAREGKSQAERSQRLRNVALEEDTVSSLDNQTDSTSQTTTATATTTCTQQLDNLLVYFEVRTAFSFQRLPSQGSGAEDEVVVTSIQLINNKTP